MSAAIQLRCVWAAQESRLPKIPGTPRPPRPADLPAPPQPSRPPATLAFYRRHTESLLRRYLYASMLVGRTPAILGEPIARGWAACRTIKTFEDAVIFVLDVERCLDRLQSLEREMLARVVLQSYTQSEAAQLMGMSMRTIAAKYPVAVDRLTEQLLNARLLNLPH